jgi:hypothetical protein
VAATSRPTTFAGQQCGDICPPNRRAGVAPNADSWPTGRRSPACRSAQGAYRLASKAGLLGPPRVDAHRLSAGQPGGHRERHRATTTARKATGPRRPTSARMRVHDSPGDDVPRRPRASQSKITITAFAVRAPPGNHHPRRFAPGVDEHPLLFGLIWFSPNLLTWQISRCRAQPLPCDFLARRQARICPFSKRCCIGVVVAQDRRVLPFRPNRSAIMVSSDNAKGGS